MEGGISTFFIWTSLDLDAPRLGRGVDRLLHQARDGVLRLQDLVEAVLAQHGAQGSERNLFDGVGDGADFHHRTLGIDDAVPHHRVDLDRDVVARDALLPLDGSGDRAQVDPGLPLDQEPDDVDARPCRAIVLAQPEDHAALVLVGDADALEEQQEHQQGDDDFGDLRE
jgi:hypothetical protein